MSSSLATATATVTATATSSSSLLSSPLSALSLAVKPITSIYPKVWFSALPEPARFVTSAFWGNIIFFYIDSVLYNRVIHPLSVYDFTQMDNKKAATKVLLFLLPSKKVLQKNRESISFFISYLIQIFAQHFLNAFFVYGLESISTKDKYCSTLFLTYSSYFVSLVGSTICNISLLRRGLSKNVAFWGTVIGFGFFNFVALKYLIGEKQLNEQDQNNDQQENSSSGGSTKNGKKGKQTNKLKDNNNNNNDGNNSNRKNNNNSKAGNKKGKKSESVFTRKMRGGALFDTCSSSSTSTTNTNVNVNMEMNTDDINSLIMKAMGEITSFLVGTRNNNANDSQMAFVKSIGYGINLHQKVP